MLKHFFIKIKIQFFNITVICCFNKLRINKTIQNHKSLFIVRNKDTNIIYPQFIEATYNGDTKELYLDFYEKQFKHIIKVGD